MLFNHQCDSTYNVLSVASRDKTGKVHIDRHRQIGLRVVLSAHSMRRVNVTTVFFSVLFRLYFECVRLMPSCSSRFSRQVNRWIASPIKRDQITRSILSAKRKLYQSKCHCFCAADQKSRRIVALPLPAILHSHNNNRLMPMSRGKTIFHICIAFTSKRSYLFDSKFISTRETWRWLTLRHLIAANSAPSQLIWPWPMGDAWVSMNGAHFIQ